MQPPGDSDVARGLEKLGKQLAAQTELPEEQYQKWSGALLAQGPELGEVLVETAKRTSKSGLRPSLERLLGMPMPVPARRHLRQVLAATS